MSRALTAALFVAGLGACTYIYGLDDFAGEQAADAGSSDGTTDGTGSGDGSATDSGSADGARPVAFECDAGIIAHWPMDEGSGIDVRDRCPSHLDTTFHPGSGTATWGKRGDSGCVQITGSAYVGRSQRPELQLTGPFTIAGFVRFDAWPTAYAALYWNFNGSLATGVEMTFSYDKTIYAQLGFGTTNVKVPYPSLVEGAWSHLAVVFVPNERIETFTNGKSVGKATPPSGNIAVNSNDVAFGTVDQTWTGAVDDVIVFSRALSVEEIAALAAR